MAQETHATLEWLTPDDWRTYRDLRLAALAEAPYAFGSKLEDERALIEADWRGRLGRRVQCAARLGTVVVGTAGGKRSDDGAAELVSLWVRPDARGKGVGDLLVRAVLAWAGEHGHRTMRLWVTEGNDAAERLYGRHGFIRTGDSQPVEESDPTRLEVRLEAVIG